MPKQDVAIQYYNRDFTNIKGALVDYARRYFPETFKDFSEASFGAMMVDMVAYMGDVLSFYLDYQANECFIDSALEFENVERLARQMGYRSKGSPASSGVATFYIRVPKAMNSQGPDNRLIPLLIKGTECSTDENLSFTLAEDVDFNNSQNEIIVAQVDATTGEPLSYAIKAYGRVISGEIATESIAMGAYESLRRVQLGSSFISEVISVVDSEGHRYYEVENLSQDTIFRKVLNSQDSDKDAPLFRLVPQSVPRRYTTETINGITVLQFGYGSDSSLKDVPLTKMSDVTLKLHGKDYVTNTSFDPTRLNETDKLGISPSNTILEIVVRKNNRESTNVTAGGLSAIGFPQLEFPNDPDSTAGASREQVYGSIEISNEEPIVGNYAQTTADEIRERAIGSYASQNRAVTLLDYKSIIYRMPPSFGAISACNLVQDPDSLHRNINIYVLSLNQEGFYTKTNVPIKENLKTWISNYKMINDTVDIMDGRIVNYGIEFTAVGSTDRSKFQTITAIRDSIINYLEVANYGIGDHVSITDLYRVINDTIGVVDAVDVQIVPKMGISYTNESFDFSSHTSPDGRSILTPKDVVLTLRYPDNDIVGTIK